MHRKVTAVETPNETQGQGRGTPYQSQFPTSKIKEETGLGTGLLTDRSVVSPFPHSPFVFSSFTRSPLAG